MLNRLAFSILFTVGIISCQIPQTFASVFYKMDVVAVTGQAGLTGMGNQVSINENGMVAFMGQLANGSSIFVGNGTSAPRNITPSHVRPQRVFGDAVQINNANRVVAQDRASGAPPATFIRIWDANTPDSDVVIARGGTGQAFTSVLGPPSINRTNQVTFAATNGSRELLVSGTTPTNLPFPLRPVIDDNGRIVVRAANPPNPEIRLYNNNLSAYTVIARVDPSNPPPSRFRTLGQSPGISRDGAIIVFAGDRGNGQGIFASIDDGSGTRQLVRIAGENTPAGGLPPDLGYDESGSPINFSAFDVESRVAVARFSPSGPVAAGDTFVVCFMATPARASRPNPTLPPGGRPLFFTNQRGIWTVRVDVQRQLQGTHQLVYHPDGALPVVQIGDKVGDFTITNLGVRDAIANALTDDSGSPRTARRGDHRMAFWASTNMGQAILRASHLDSDEDGLLDHWEMAGGGIDIDQDGIIDLDLNAMGADPYVRDLFLEIDWLADQPDHVHGPPPGMVLQLAIMFALAPGLPNGVPPGINLHVDAGLGTDALGNPLSFGMASGPFQGGDMIGQPSDPTRHIDIVYFGVPGSLTVPGGVEARAFHDIKDNFFGNADKRARELVFHYVVLADFHSFLLNGAGSPFTASVTAATSNTLTSSISFGTANLSGHALKIIAGTGVGQVRVIKMNTSTQLTVTSTWTTVPDTTSTFALFNGSSGLGELGIWASPDFNSIPGNDVVIALRGFGINAKGWLANACVHWRTLAHELGHNLGLRHCGTNPDASACRSTPAAYQSLMSYAHQVALCPATSPVTSYSGVSDPTFDDWGNLKEDFYNSAIYLGNTFLRLVVLGDISALPDREVTVDDYEQLNQSPVDLIPPTVRIDSPSSGDQVLLGSSLIVNLTATDNVSVSSVVVSFDIDGDGSVDGPGETIEATPLGNNRYRAIFDNISGPAGDRDVIAVATDSSLNMETDAVTITVR